VSAARREGCVVAFFPPVRGGYGMAARVTIQAAEFDVAA
jgi:hypothetical protein